MPRKTSDQLTRSVERLLKKSSMIFVNNLKIHRFITVRNSVTLIEAGST